MRRIFALVSEVQKSETPVQSKSQYAMLCLSVKSPFERLLRVGFLLPPPSFFGRFEGLKDLFFPSFEFCGHQNRWICLKENLQAVLGMLLWCILGYFLNDLILQYLFHDFDIMNQKTADFTSFLRVFLNLLNLLNLFSYIYWIFWISLPPLLYINAIKERLRFFSQISNL